MTSKDVVAAALSLDLRGVAAFAAVAAHGSYTRAARELCFDQSTVTRQVQQLERCLRVRLLDRSAQGVALTDHGRRFLPHARGVLDAARAAAGSVVQREGHSPDLPDG